MTKDLVDDVVKAHLESFPGFFLSFLGERFLKVYYRGIIEHPDSIKLVYLDNKELSGFVIGIMNPSAFYSALLKHDWFRFTTAAVPALLKRPRSFVRLVRAIKKPGAAVKDVSTCELTSLAVCSSARNRGIGKALVTAFIEKVCAQSGSAIYLSTDSLNNDGANNFYQRMGFKIRRSYQTPENRLMNEYWYQIRAK